MSTKGRLDRTILTLGPPHSGKSVFAYLLFKFLREFGDDTALFDCDIFGPTFRAHNLASDEEAKHIYLTPNYYGPPTDIPLATFENFIELNFLTVRERGLIILDGLGKHSDKTKALLKRSKRLAILCKNELTNEQMDECGYKVKGTPTHPFEFYGGPDERVLQITTYKDSGDSEADLTALTGKLFGLSREAIDGGRILSIPKTTCETIRTIAKYFQRDSK